MYSREIFDTIEYMYTLPDLDHGLSKKQVTQRQHHFGPNLLESKRTDPAWKLFLSQFQSPLIYVLMIAGILTLLMGHYLDSVIIILVVVINSLLGFYQEHKTSKALEALRQYLKPQVQVIRDGRRQSVELRELVPGDVVLVNVGESVPADGVFISNQLLNINEAILTGESASVSKQSRRLQGLRSLGEISSKYNWRSFDQHWGFMGTTVMSGYGKMLVLKTGHNTRIGHIADQLRQAQDQSTPLQIQISQLARRLMYLIGFITVAMFGLGLVRGVSWTEMLVTSVAVAVAAIPEGLVIAMTVILAIGMQRIFRRKALVRSLIATETLGSVSVICADKTGTLTMGQMQVTEHSGSLDEMIRVAVLTGDDRDEESRAMSHWASKQLADTKLSWTPLKSVSEIRQTFRTLKVLPFDSKSKYTASLVHGPKQSYLCLAGAPEAVMERVQLSSLHKQEIVKDLDRLAGYGHRLIALAGTKVSGTSSSLKQTDLTKLEWYGFLAFSDPLRPAIKQTLSQARKAGVKVKVITGDHRETAKAVLTPVMGHLSDSEVITGPELEEMTETEILERIDSTILFARTTPEQKLSIVRALQSTGQVVAMTGDGVNDAPALKAADIGIVVNEATDVSKQTADMVLLDSNLGTIVTAIKEGRGVYESIRKVTAYLLSDCFQELILIGGSLLLGLPLPITAAQILWINLVQDSFLGVSLAFDKAKRDLMNRPPRSRQAPLIDKQTLSLISVIVVVSNLGLLLLYAWLLGLEIETARLQTIIFSALAINSLFYIFSIKSLGQNIWQVDLFDNKLLLGAVGLGFVLTLAAVYTPVLQLMLGTVSLSLVEIMGVFSLGVITVSTIEVVKLIKRKV